MTADEDLDWGELSLCVDCAKHLSLKKFITCHAGSDERCGVCLRSSDQTVVCSLSDRLQLSHLVRALIRFYHSEIEYNHHFGGDAPGVVLCRESEILDINHAVECGRQIAEIEEFAEDLATNPRSLSWDDGIWIFHQNDGGLAHALKNSRSPILRSMSQRLERENYFNLEPELKPLFAEIGPRIDISVPAGTRYHRARIGVSARLWRRDELGFDGRPVWIPYQAAELGSPPAPLASAGRLNRAGVSFLYLASDADTAAREIRPHPGHEISVGEFQSARDLRLANFDTDIALFSKSDTDLDLYHFVYSTDVAMSLPVVPGASHRYSITQLIADVLRQSGYDGVAFKSSVGTGQNLCIFDPAAFAFVEGSAHVLRVEEVMYRTLPLEADLAPGKNDWEL